MDCSAYIDKFRCPTLLLMSVEQYHEKKVLLEKIVEQKSICSLP